MFDVRRDVNFAFVLFFVCVCACVFFVFFLKFCRIFPRFLRFSRLFATHFAVFRFFLRVSFIFGSLHFATIFCNFETLPFVICCSSFAIVRGSG